MLVAVMNFQISKDHQSPSIFDHPQSGNSKFVKTHGLRNQDQIYVSMMYDFFITSPLGIDVIRRSGGDASATMDDHHREQLQSMDQNGKENFPKLLDSVWLPRLV